MNKLSLYSLFLALGVLTALPCVYAAEDTSGDPKTQTDASPKPDVEAPEALPPGFTGSYLSGRFARSNGDTQDALHYLIQAHKDDPNNVDVASQLQSMLLLQGNITEATKLAQDIHDSQGQDSISDLLLTLKEIKADHMDDAAKILDSAFESDSGQLWVPLVSAWVDVARKKMTKPLTIEQLTVNVGHAAPLIYYHLALINAHAGFTDEAAKDFKNAIEDPKNPPTRIMQVLLQFYNANNSPDVLTPVVTEYQKAHPNEPAPLEAPHIVTPQDGIAEVFFTMGSIMLGADVGQDATIYLHLALYMKPDFALAAMTLADAYADLHEYAAANDIYAHILPENPYYNRARFQMAFNEDHLGHLKEALSMLDVLAKQFPHNYEVWIAKADLLRQHGRYGDAVTAYTEALDRIPDLQSQHWPIFFARGSSYEQQGKWKEAEADLKEALELNPDQPDVVNYLAYSWVVRGEHLEEARDMLQKALAVRPDDAEIVDSMGWALYRLGNYSKSVEFLEKAVELLPGDAEVNDHLGDAYWRVGRKTEAQYEWRRALNSSPETKLAGELQRKIKDGLPAAVVGDAEPSVSEPAKPAETE